MLGRKPSRMVTPGTQFDRSLLRSECLHSLSLQLLTRDRGERLTSAVSQMESLGLTVGFVYRRARLQ